MNYTIVNPSFELLSPCTKENYLEFLELCTRICYKSEDLIQPGSAEKLLNKVVNEYGHHSVVEHANCVIQISDPYISEIMFQEFVLINPLLNLSYRDDNRETLLISGNIRMWKEFLERYPQPGKSKCPIGHGIDYCLNQQWSFFFTSDNRPHEKIKLLDSNPITNKDNLTKEELLKHTTLTGKFISSRTMSHQLVRHRRNTAFSQESMRFCNYNKKGLQVIFPKSLENIQIEVKPTELSEQNYNIDAKDLFELTIDRAYETYLKLLGTKISPEDARFILPNATKTEVITTMTLEMWRHCIKHRGYNSKAQWEIRELFLEAEKQINNVISFKIYE